ncbi:MAG TPA: proline dehydrogenase family protein [Candidatus Limnocylindrales bacterium]|jgi:proline dehydrogenase
MSLATTFRSLPERAMRTALLSLSRRRSIGRLASRLPVTRGLVDRFVAGETLGDSIPALEGIRDAGFHATIDILGESVASIGEARVAVDAYLEALAALAERGLDRNVSLKLSQMGLGVDPDACRAGVAEIMARAAELGAFVRIDMEDHTTTDATLALWRALRPINAGRGDSGVVIQAALRRSAADLEALIGEGARVRLCKGAYKEPDDIAFQGKAEVDVAYGRLMERLLASGNFPAIATHDERLIARAMAFTRSNGIGRERFEFQMLYGIRRDLQERLRAQGYSVHVYVPYGVSWYPYFMRRLAERPANVGFLLRNLMREGRRAN